MRGRYLRCLLLREQAERIGGPCFERLVAFTCGPGSKLLEPAPKAGKLGRLVVSRFD